MTWVLIIVSVLFLLLMTTLAFAWWATSTMFFGPWKDEENGDV